MRLQPGKVCILALSGESNTEWEYQRKAAVTTKLQKNVYFLQECSLNPKAVRGDRMANDGTCLQSLGTTL